MSWYSSSYPLYEYKQTMKTLYQVILKITVPGFDVSYCWGCDGVIVIKVFARGMRGDCDDVWYIKVGHRLAIASAG